MCRVSNRYGVYEHKITLKVLRKSSYELLIVTNVVAISTTHCIEVALQPTQCDVVLEKLKMLIVLALSSANTQKHLLFLLYNKNDEKLIKLKLMF